MQALSAAICVQDFSQAHLSLPATYASVALDGEEPHVQNDAVDNYCGGSRCGSSRPTWADARRSTGLDPSLLPQAGTAAECGCCMLLLGTNLSIHYHAPLVSAARGRLVAPTPVNAMTSQILPLTSCHRPRQSGKRSRDDAWAQRQRALTDAEPGSRCLLVQARSASTPKGVLLKQWAGGVLGTRSNSQHPRALTSIVRTLRTRASACSDGETTGKEWLPQLGLTSSRMCHVPLPTASSMAPLALLWPPCAARQVATAPEGVQQLLLFHTRYPEVIWRVRHSAAQRASQYQVSTTHRAHSMRPPL